MTVSEKQLRAFADELRKHWSFDDGQMHTHSWHDRENFIERKLPALLTAALSDQVVVPKGYLIWWTNENDCERIVPLETWPVYLYDQYQSRQGRNGRGRLWCSDKLKDAPEGVTIDWDTLANWLCKAAEDAGGIVIKAEHAVHVQYLPGFLTTFEMALPAAPSPASPAGEGE